METMKESKGRNWFLVFHQSRDIPVYLISSFGYERTRKYVYKDKQPYNIRIAKVSEMLKVFSGTAICIDLDNMPAPQFFDMLINNTRCRVVILD